MSNIRHIIDLHIIQPRDRHPLIFRAFDALEAGQALELVNAYEPSPLYFQFSHQWAGQFEWQPVESGPEVWRVLIHTQPGV